MFKLRELDNEYYLRQNFETIRRYTQEDFYKRWLCPGDFSWNSGASTGVMHTSYRTRWPSVSFSNTNTSHIFSDIYIPTLWVDGEIETTLFYGADSAAGNNFRIRVIASLTADGSPNNVTEYDQTDTYPEPATTATTAAQIVSVTATVTSADRLFGISIGRPGATDPSDTATGTFHLFGVLLRYIPNKL